MVTFIKSASGSSHLFRVVHLDGHATCVSCGVCVTGEALSCLLPSSFPGCFTLSTNDILTGFVALGIMNAGIKKGRNLSVWVDFI